MSAILMTEDYWANTQFSIVRHTGGMKWNGYEYIIVDKHGRDIFECSYIAEMEGREKAIEPGEPADLCRKDFVPFYRQLGRERFIEVLKAHPRESEGELKKIYKSISAEEKKRKAEEKKKREPRMFED